MTKPASEPCAKPRYWSDDAGFWLCLAILGGSYVVLIIAMLVADLFFTSPGHLLEALSSHEIQYAIKLSMISCSITALLSMWVAVPMGYLLARRQFWGKFVVDTLLDIPIVLPPLVIGLSLLILFQTWPGQFFQQHFFTVTYAVPSVILAQFSVATAFAVRTMRVTFEQISPRAEQVAMTLGCTRAQAFWRVVMPEARRGLLTAATLSWARSLGEFGPILIFSGATRFRTEVLPTTVFLELSVGRIEAAIAVSLLMIAVAVVVLVIMRTLGLRRHGSGVTIADYGLRIGEDNLIEAGMIDVDKLCLRQGAFRLEGVSLHIPEGKYAILMGKTGCGKTTVLEAIAGLRPINAGRIVLNGRDVTYLTPSQRDVGYVPQDGALFCTMTVRDNLAFALHVRHVAAARFRERVEQLAEWLHLTHLLERRAVGLSGGETQRIALGRALANHPPVLLMDEPLSSLDEETRDQLIDVLRGLPQRARVTVLHISHSKHEAEQLGEMIFRLHEGRIAVITAETRNTETGLRA